MGSRLMLHPEQTFYWFFEATCPVARDKDPGVSFQFPEDFSDEESCQTLPRFCFPFDILRARDGAAVQHFTFVLTDLKGYRRFGFCRLANTTHSCLCILSYLPWFEVFYKLLNNLADYLSKGQTNEMKALLAALYQQPIPLAAGSITLQMGEQLLVSTEVSPSVGHLKRQEGVPYFIAPDPRSLPSIPENRNLTELIVAVDVGNLLQLYASMLFERRILFFASKLSTLTSCVHAISAVIYPMYWQHIFIPVMPPHLLDYCCAPMPYLIGVHTSLSERVRSLGLEEVVILNVDTNTLETPFEDLKRIPSDVLSGLKVCLKQQAVSPGCGVSRAFLKAQALLFGGYRDGLHAQDGEISFCKKTFLENKSPNVKQFLQSAIHLQFFKQFIDSRLDILNIGEEPADLFEEEILKHETTEGKSKPYQQLVGNLKKGGGALILNMKSKANMRAKGLAKSGLKWIMLQKAHSEQYNLQRGGSVSHRRAQSDSLQDRLPITQHFGKSRPRRPVHKSRAPRDTDSMKDTEEAQDGAVCCPVAEPDLELQRDEEEDADSSLCDPEEMDLLGEIFDSLSSRSSYERGMLYGTRSLDLFGPDSHDYITNHGTANPSQESLSLSISGSLHSWNVETTEELSDVNEDSDWVCSATRGPEEGGTDRVQAVCEVEEQEKGQREDGERWEEVKTETKESQGEETGNTDDFIRETIVEEQKTEVQENCWSSVDNFVNETMEKQEDDEMKDKRENDQDKEDTAEKEMERKRNQVSKSVAGNERDTKKGEEEESFGSKLPKSLEKPEKTTPSSEALHVAAESQSAAGELQKNEGMKREEEGEMRQTPPPPKVQSAKARFQTEEPCQGVQLKSRTKAWTDPGRPPSGEAAPTCSPPSRDSQTNSSPEVSEEEKVRSAIKVSELKKRFEA